MANAEIKITTKGAAEVERKLAGIGGAFSKLKNRAAGVGVTLNKLKNSFLSFQNAAVIVGAGLAIKKAFDFVELGASIEKQKAAFKSLAESHGANADEILKDLKEMSRGTVDTLSLMQSANKALLLGIDPKEFTKLMRIARAASKATGDSITKSFEDITTGIGRQSGMILDNLGIIVKVEEANERYAEQLGKTTADLTDAEKRQAFLNATIKSGEAIVEGVGEDYLNSSDKIERFKVKLREAGQRLATIAVVIFEKMAPALTFLVEKFTAAIEAIFKGVRTLNEYRKKLMSLISPSKEWGDVLTENAEKTEDSTNKHNALSAALHKTTAAQEGLNDAFKKRMAALGKASEGVSQAQGDKAFGKINKQAKLRNKLDQRGIAITKEMRTAQEKLNDRLKELNELRAAGAISQETLSRASKKAVENFKVEMTDLQRHTRDTFDRMKGPLTEFFLNMNQGWSNMQNLATNVMSTIKRKLAELAADRAINFLFSKLTGGIGGGGGGRKGIFGLGGVLGIFHKGGVVGSGGQPTRQLAFAGVPRMHSGGLARDEVPAILQKREGVLSRKGMANLDKLNLGNAGGEGAGQVININVTVPTVIRAIDTQSGAQFLMSRESSAAIVANLEREILSNSRIRTVLGK